MDFKNELNNFIKVIENRIRIIIPSMEPKLLYEPFNYIMQEGGKRIRPVLTMVCSGVTGGNPYDAVDCGVAIEILHNFTLVHDDIMDGSPLRRGRPTVHVKWNNDVAILTGDVMIGYAYKILPNSKQHNRSDEILRIFTNELIEVCEGQVLDMEFNNRKDVTMLEYIYMIDKKTARLIEASCTIGAHLSFADEPEIESIKRIAHNAGLGFQIQDDLLDMTADQSKLGKKIGKDIIEGKKTFLILVALKNADKTHDKELLDLFYSNNGLSEQYIPEMDELFKRTGAYDLAKEQVQIYFQNAYKEFENLKQNQYTQMFRWLIESIEKRNF